MQSKKQMKMLHIPWEHYIFPTSLIMTYSNKQRFLSEENEFVKRITISGMPDKLLERTQGAIYDVTL